MSVEFCKHKESGYLMGINPSCSVAPADIVALVRGDTEGSSAVLSGRGAVVRGDLPAIGPVVVKQYLRGGLLSNLGSWHLRVGETRPSHEMRALQKVRLAGVHAPEPIAWVTKGHLLYRGWLVLREIAGDNLAELSMRDEEAAIAAIPSVVNEVRMLVEEGVFHIDLHPGNVIVAENGSASIIDFDRAFFPCRYRDLAERYLRRWRRAVIKHGLPESLMEHFSLGIRSNGALSGA